MRRSARREVNRDSLELWLVTRGVGVSTRPPSHPDEYHGRVGKPGARYNQDDTWLMAISMPDAIAANRFFEDSLAVLSERYPAMYAVLRVCYTGPASDPSLPEQWRQKRKRIDLDETMRYSLGALLLMLDLAYDEILERAEREKRLLYWPSPEEAKGYVETNLRKRRDALYYYERNMEEGDSTTLAVKKAAVAARCSQQAVWKWLAQLAGASWASGATGNSEAKERG